MQMTGILKRIKCVLFDFNDSNRRSIFDAK